MAWVAITQTTTYAIAHMGDRLGLTLLGLRKLPPCICFARYVLRPALQVCGRVKTLTRNFCGLGLCNFRTSCRFSISREHTWRHYFVKQLVLVFALKPNECDFFRLDALKSICVSFWKANVNSIFKSYTYKCTRSHLHWNVYTHMSINNIFSYDVPNPVKLKELSISQEFWSAFYFIIWSQ